MNFLKPIPVEKNPPAFLAMAAVMFGVAYLLAFRLDVACAQLSFFCSLEVVTTSFIDTAWGPFVVPGGLVASGVWLCYGAIQSYRGKL